MSLSWRDELRVGLCADRLVMARRRAGLRSSVSHETLPVDGNPASALQAIAGDSTVAVVLSNHFCRYAVLKASAALKTEHDWDAYARHELESSYGNEVARWRVRLSRTGAQHTRVACAVDAELVEQLRSLSRLKSVQPYLMSAFNARRRALAKGSAWFVIQEPTRLAIALLVDGGWKLIRMRQVASEWQSNLAALLDREAALSGAAEATRAVLCCEDPAPASAGRYEISDLSLPQKADVALRPHLMALH